MRKTQKGFTLVELIVVITILAILGTIAFISLGSYTADARNAKRTEGIGKLASAVDNGTISGTPIMAFVIGTESELSNIALAGTGSTGVAADAYNAGNPNASALNINADQFTDPQTSDSYKMGVTSLSGGAFQVASIVEDPAGSKAKVVGSYNQRTLSGSIASGELQSTTKFKISDLSKINYFKAGDEVELTGSGAETAEILAVSNDGTTLTLVSAITNLDNDSVQLAVNESAGLIASASDDTVAVANGSGATLPY